MKVADILNPDLQSPDIYIGCSLFSLNSIALEADYVTVVEGRPINTCRISSFIFGQI